MAARPLPGAPYHTADFAFHSSPDVDPEALDSYGPSEKELETRIHLPLQTSQGTAHLRCGTPVMLLLLLLCCLAFVASAFMGSAFGDQLAMPCVPERHAPLADQISAAFQTQPHVEWVYETRAGALDILKQKHNTSRVGCHAANVRDYMRQSYPVVRSSLDWTNVSQSAVVLHWQGADRELKPVVIANSPAVLDLEGPDPIFEWEIIEHVVDLADVESAVGMLTAVEALVQSGYQPSRTLVLSLMLGEASDARKMSDYLHATYDEHGLQMDFKPPPMPRRLPKMLHALHALFGRLYRGVTSLYPIPATPHCLRVASFDNDKPRFIRYSLDTRDEAALRIFSARAVSDWAFIILGAGGK